MYRCIHISLCMCMCTVDFTILHSPATFLPGSTSSCPACPSRAIPSAWPSSTWWAARATQRCTSCVRRMGWILPKVGLLIVHYWDSNLVGGLVAINFEFSQKYWEWIIIPIDEVIFFRGVAKNHQPVMVETSAIPFKIENCKTMGCMLSYFPIAIHHGKLGCSLMGWYWDTMVCSWDIYVILRTSCGKRWLQSPMPELLYVAARFPTWLELGQRDIEGIQSHAHGIWDVIQWYIICRLKHQK